MTSRSRSMFCPRFASSFALLDIGGRREDRVLAAPAVSRAVAHSKRRTRAYRYSGNTPAFPAQWLYGLLRALPGERLFCLRRPSSSFASQRTQRQRRGARTTRLRRTPHVTYVVVTSASIASHRAFVTIAKRPSSCRETGGVMRLICPTC